MTEGAYRETGRIDYRLDLVLRLTDAATGKPVPEGGAVILEKGKDAGFLKREGGVCILVNHPCRPAEYEVRAPGYEPEPVYLDGKRREEGVLTMEVELLPRMKRGGYPAVRSLEGRLRRILELEAVNSDAPYDFVMGYAEKKRIVKLRYGCKFTEGEGNYALVRPGSQTYERLSVAGKEDRMNLLLKEPLTSGFLPGDRICRIIHGKVRQPGRYVLRVMEGAREAGYLVRYSVGEEVRFWPMSFSGADYCRLPDDSGREREQEWHWQ